MSGINKKTLFIIVWLYHFYYTLQWKLVLQTSCARRCPPTGGQTRLCRWPSRWLRWATSWTAKFFLNTLPGREINMFCQENWHSGVISAVNISLLLKAIVSSALKIPVLHSFLALDVKKRFWKICLVTCWTAFCGSQRLPHANALR